MLQKLLTHTLSALALLSGVGTTVYAAVIPPPVNAYTNPVWAQLNIDSIPCFLLALVNLVFFVVGPIIVICIIYAGFMFVSAQGNETKIAKARTILTWTLIGAGVLLSAKAISLAIEATLVSVSGGGSVGPLCP